MSSRSTEGDDLGTDAYKNRTHKCTRARAHTQTDISGRTHMQTVCIQRKAAEFSGGANRLSARVRFVNYNLLQSAGGFADMLGLRG